MTPDPRELPTVDLHAATEMVDDLGLEQLAMSAEVISPPAEPQMQFLRQVGGLEKRSRRPAGSGWSSSTEYLLLGGDHTSVEARSVWVGQIRRRTAKLELRTWSQNWHPRRFQHSPRGAWMSRAAYWFAAGTISIFSGIAVWRAPDDALHDAPRNLLLPGRNRSRHRRLVPSH